MRRLKNFFRKPKEEPKKENECWYNNFHETKKETWIEPEEGMAFSSPNQMYYTTAQQAAKQQN